MVTKHWKKHPRCEGISILGQFKIHLKKALSRQMLRKVRLSAGAQ